MATFNQISLKIIELTGNNTIPTTREELISELCTVYEDDHSVGVEMIEEAVDDWQSNIAYSISYNRQQIKELEAQLRKYQETLTRLTTMRFEAA